MHQVHLELTDQAYNQAKLRAASAGFRSVDEYIADVVSNELSEDTAMFDHQSVRVVLTPNACPGLDHG